MTSFWPLMLPEQLFLPLPPLLAEQDELQLPVPTVLGGIDHRTWRRRLEWIDEILHVSRVGGSRGAAVPEVARTLTADSLRVFAARLADSSLLRWFCRLRRLMEGRRKWSSAHSCCCRERGAD